MRAPDCRHAVMDFLTRVQISNYWMLVLAAVVVIWIIYRFIAG
jgi:hypothetical protein